jgi:2-oxoglutarate dehydrogenase E2 component (dihydrolipoamide succinyltransferase)
MAIAELVMPKLGESIMEATILKWHKKVGDHVKLDETVLDIATDKVDSEVPSTVEGIITEILYNINDVVPIGTVIVRVETTTLVVPAPITTVEPPVVVETPPVAETPPPVAETPPPVVEVPYTPSAPMVELMAKPASNRFYSPLVLNIANSEGINLSELERIPGTGNDGRVSKKDILQYVADKKAGKVPTYQPAPVYAAAPQYIAAVTPTPVPVVEATAPAPQPVVTEQQPITLIPASTTAPVYQEPIVPVFPATQATYHTAPEPIIKSGTRFPEQNVEANTPPMPPSPQAIFAQHSGKYSDPSMVTVTGATEIIEMDRMRKLIAKHMVDSKHTSPHVTSFAEADVTNMVMWRTKVKNEFEQREGTKLTFTPMFVECIANVIKRFPYINCSLEGDKIILKKDINIGMATALPSGNLIVPVIKGADQMNIVGLSKAVNGLADAARNAKLKPEDTTGGTFTLTNVGTFGSLMGTPIISQPQVAIMAVGAIKKRPMVMEGPDGDTIAIRHMMYLSLSYDHRIVDGSIGASFLTEVAKEFEKWDINKQWFHYL